MSPRLGVQWHANSLLQPQTPGLRETSASVSQVAGTMGMCHHAQLIKNFFLEMGSYCVAQAGLKLLAPSDPLASQSAGITGMSHCAQPNTYIF